MDGIGYLDPKTTGYSDYASCGYYEISGSYPPLTTNIQEQQAASDFVLYPNPANDKIYVAFSDPAVQAHDVKISNSLGQIIYMAIQPQLQNGIDISHFARGIYIVQVTDEKTKAPAMKKFIKE